MFNFFKITIEGLQPDFFVKVYFEIAVDQGSKTKNQTFGGVPDPMRPSLPAARPRPVLAQDIPKAKLVVALLVDPGLLSMKMYFFFNPPKTRLLK